ncbi:MAG: hypothetical protein ACTHOL_17895, partial [Luteibacter jiangsuensis]
PEHHFPLGVIPNVAHQTKFGFLKAKTFWLGIVEFDDQGRCYRREQLDKLSGEIEKIRTDKRDAIVLVFVHGWKHDARSDDANLTSFRGILKRTAEHEADCAAPGEARPVMGIFIGWRGMTAHGLGDLGADTTFWGRQEAAHRVSTGSVRELFGRLRHYRNSRVKNGGNAVLVIAGHSFGGMIVQSALAQSLIEAASVPADHIVPRFADLVLLVNPAVEGARYLPIHDLVTSEEFKRRKTPQLPVFVCVQALNDQPVGTFFPIGNFKNRLEEASIGALEKRCVSHAIGFIDEFHTHHVAGPAGGKPFVLNPPETARPNPYWVVTADKAVIDGHGGIWQDPFLSFLAALVFKHVNVSRTPVAVEPSGAAPLGKALSAKAAAAAPDASEDLATFASKIGPVRPS